MDFCATKGIGNVGSGAEVDSILLLELCHGSEQGHLVYPEVSQLCVWECAWNLLCSLSDSSAEHTLDISWKKEV